MLKMPDEGVTVTTGRMVLQPGVYLDVAERNYHADPAPEPSLSASGAKTLLHRSPRAFAWAHPRLRPSHLPPLEEDLDDKKVFGTAVHKLVLGRGRDVVGVDADAWRTNAAKQERADIHAAGRLALLNHRFADAKAIAAELRPHVGYTPDTPTEVVLVWQDQATDGSPVWCRAMIDALPEAHRIEDLKITTAALSEAFVARQIDAMGYDLSLGWYRRGLAALRPALAGRISVTLHFAERGEPYDICSRTLTEGELHEADILCQMAIDRFAACMAAGRWPGVNERRPGALPIPIPNWKKRALLDAALAEELHDLEGDET